MGNKSPNQNNDDNKSISSVLNLSLDSKKEQKVDSLNNDNISDILLDLKTKISIPIENEYIESTEILLDQKEEELKIKFFFENKADEIITLDMINRKRSKTFMQKISKKNTPKPHPIESNEYISPLKLSIKSYGNISIWNKKPNPVLYDFQKNIIDCKSCNDEESLDDFFLYNAETERNTPNVEDLQNLFYCRKIMTIFRNSISERNLKEYENILDSDYTFKENIENNINNHHQKKHKFWYKHIKQQQLKDKNKDQLHSKRICSEPTIKGFEHKDEVGDECGESKNDHGLFILGILESAANERKGRKTTNA